MKLISFLYLLKLLSMGCRGSGRAPIITEYDENTQQQSILNKDEQRTTEKRLLKKKGGVTNIWNSGK